MIIEKAEIKKFRGFEDVEFNLGSQLTVFAGQNGTQKTTLLGMLTQPFTITAEDNPMRDEKPLCGGSFKSAFNEKFKLSETFDKAKMHEWTLHIKSEPTPFVIESISRNKAGEIRFWRKGNRDKGSGYIQLPVIYLSLKRLIPIGEDDKLNENSSITLTNDEKEFYKLWHNKILITFDKLETTNYLESPSKNTIGITTDLYDWKQNSAGQDNLGKILLAILSFKRLKDKYKSKYTGGILAIDELDATLYPASQIKLILALRKFASNFNIQIIFSTHSLSILESVSELQKEYKEARDQIKVIFLEKNDDKIQIKHRLNVTIEGKAQAKINVFTEDKEAAIFAKALLKGLKSKLEFIDCALSCSGLINLAKQKIPPFIFPNSIIFLDGDVRSDTTLMTKINTLSNIIILPSTSSPERILAEYLWKLEHSSDVWSSINKNYRKQNCFKDITIYEIRKDRDKAKTWFKSQLNDWGPNASKVINPWIKANKEEVEEFIADFTATYNKFAKELHWI